MIEQQAQSVSECGCAFGTNTHSLTLGVLWVGTIGCPVHPAEGLRRGGWAQTETIVGTPGTALSNPICCTHLMSRTLTSSELTRRATVGVLAAGAIGAALWPRRPRGQADVPAGRVTLQYWEKWTGPEGDAVQGDIPGGGAIGVWRSNGKVVAGVIERNVFAPSA